jgi:hypothetical protein
MGLFNDLKKSLQESPGRVMLQMLQNRAPKFKQYPDHIRKAAIESHLARKQFLLSEMDNVTPEGAIKIGIQLQKKGLQTIDFNVSEGYGIWFTGLWIESMHRSGEDARVVYDSMLSLENHSL